MPRPGVGLQLATRTHTSGPEVELWAWLAVQPAGPSPAQMCGRKGRTGTGAGLLRDVLEHTKPPLPFAQRADTRTRDPGRIPQGILDLDAQAHTPGSVSNSPGPAAYLPSCGRSFPVAAKPAFLVGRVAWDPGYFFHLSGARNLFPRTNRSAWPGSAGAQGWGRRVLPWSSITQPGDGGRHNGRSESRSLQEAEDSRGVGTAEAPTPEPVQS